MKKRLQTGFFAVLVALLIGFTSIPENSSEIVHEDLSNQVQTEQTVELVSVQYALEISEISSQFNLSEQHFIASLEESLPVLLQKETLLNQSDINSSINVLQSAGLKDETLSSEYFSETNLLAPRFRPANYFT